MASLADRDPIVPDRLPTTDALRALVEAVGRFAVVDLETTGLDPASARVIEVGAVVVGADAVPVRFQRFVDPGVPIPAITSTLTGLGEADLAGAPSWTDVAAELASLLAGSAIVAHNAAFERTYLAGLLPPGTRFLDTLELACVLRPELSGHSLERLSRDLLGRVERHRALDDAVDTLCILSILAQEVVAGRHRHLAAALGTVGDGAAWGWAPLLRAGGSTGLPAEGLGGVRGERSPGLEAATPARLPPRSTIPPSWYSAEFVTELLADEARWRRHFPGYRSRDGQITFARALMVALREDRAVAAEAGTGIGKTLAYALVGLLHGLHSGERVVVSSANRTLQERVVDEELPRIAAVLGIPRQPALVLKGRANYGCATRATELAARPGDFGFTGLAPAARLYLRSYFARCPDRDLQSFGGWLLAQESSLRGIREVLACAADCDERACRAADNGPCAYLRRVDGLADCAILSINHSLLLSWPARYGTIERLVIDEAHELAAEGDRAFREEVTSRDLRQWLAQASGPRRGGLISALALSIRDPLAGRRSADLASRCERAIDEVGRALCAACGQEERAVPRVAGESAAPVAPAAKTSVGSRAAWSAAARAVGELASDLEELAEEIARLVGAYREATGETQPRDDAVSARATSLGLSLAAAGRGLLADLFEQEREGTVYAAWSRQGREAYDWGVRATPLNVAELIHARLFEPARTVVAVSATLGVGGNPRPSLEKIGWDLIPAERRLPELVIPSPFDFRRRSVLAFAQHGTYRSRGFLDDCAQSIAAIARLLGGRTLALFTSRHRLAEVASRVEDLLAGEGIALLVQRRGGGAARLVEQFATSPRAVLLGTRSLWQGIDVPGEALSCVVIDKLPFPPPSDPLLVGRARVLRDAGGDDFRALSLEPAVVAFKQMFGRLIRAEEDRGFVVVLGADPTRPYVEDFIGSLPGPPRLLVGGMPIILDEMRRFFS